MLIKATRLSFLTSKMNYCNVLLYAITVNGKESF